MYNNNQEYIHVRKNKLSLSILWSKSFEKKVEVYASWNVID